MPGPLEAGELEIKEKITLDKYDGDPVNDHLNATLLERMTVEDGVVVSVEVLNTPVLEPLTAAPPPQAAAAPKAAAKTSTKKTSTRGKKASKKKKD